MAQRKKICLIAGGAGFIGSHLCDRMIQDGYKVICVDNLITGSQRNIAHLLENKDFSFFKQDISEEFVITGPIDYVLQFASPASPIDYLKYPIETLKVGSFGTYHMLELAKKKKARFFLASTSEVYGDPLIHPQVESYWGNVNPIGIRSVYDEAKRFAEAMTMAYQREHKIDTRIVRIFNTYGPRMQTLDGRVVPNFIYQLLHKKPLTVYGTGKQTRSFCYVDDLVEGIVRLLRSSVKTPVNLGNPCEFTMLELAQIIQKVAKTKCRIIRCPLPKDDPKQRKPNISLAKEKLKWKPVVDLKEGLSRTITWFEKQM
ncbi:MAG: SDR family oxidoreductase [Candidatus Omnitrophica bacterium]|nr:SDR family oxidoreductase [Candidatus Omnitrophota bacterium]